MNMISTLRQRVKALGSATITPKEYDQLQAEWITRVGIAPAPKVEQELVELKESLRLRTTQLAAVTLRMRQLEAGVEPTPLPTTWDDENPQIPQEWKDAVEKAIDAMQKLTPAIDAALWIGLMWNDHNHDTDAIIYKAEQAAKGLGLVRGGPDSRDTLFEGWNSAIAALRELVKE